MTNRQMLEYDVIDNNETCLSFLHKIEKSDFIAVDTEFVRKNTYYPELSLIQIADSHHAAILDPHSDSLNINIFFDYMKKQTKQYFIFHSSRQDLEIFFYLSKNSLPNNIFDTQIAMQALGISSQIGYGDLVYQYLNISLDKSQQFIDWNKRPLSKKELDYAAADVIYLAKVYPMILQDLRKNNRLDYIKHDMDSLHDSTLYDSDDNIIWQRLKKTKKFNARQRIIIRDIAKWREKIAKSKNLPRHYILKDETILAIAAYNPQSHDELTNIRGLTSSHHTEQLLKILKKANAIDIKKAPPPLEKAIQLNNKESSLLDMLNLLLQITAKKENIAAQLICSQDDLKKFIKNPKNNKLSILHDWRCDIFGQKALDLMTGKIALSYQKQGIKIVNIT